MSEDQLQAFIAKVKADSSLQETLKSAKTGADVVNIAKGVGFDLSENDLANAKIDLSDAELESMAGGGGGLIEDDKLGYYDSSSCDHDSCNS